MLEEASPENLAECCRILALNVAHYRSRFGDLPLEESLNLLATETIDDDQAKWLADGMESIVAVLGMLQDQTTEH
jgi:hypothetical protein